MSFLVSYITFVVLGALGVAIAIFFTVMGRTQNQKAELLSSESGLAWWVEITTQQPDCTYYFGPFARAEEARQSQAGYIQDLDKEGPQAIAAQIKWGNPQELTICQG